MKWHLSEEIIIRANISSSTQLSEGFYQIPGESRIKLYLDIRWINAFGKWGAMVGILLLLNRIKAREELCKSEMLPVPLNNEKCKWKIAFCKKEMHISEMLLALLNRKEGNQKINFLR